MPRYERTGRLLGRGGMGAVEEGIQVLEGGIKRKVALKRVLYESQLKEFKQEARAILSLSNHDNIVTAHDFYTDSEEGHSFLVMELIEGVTLDELLYKDDIPTESVACILDGLLLALRTAHEQKIIHRDLKPSNIFVTREGRPKLSDFGLAKWMDAEQDPKSSIKGTFVYMSPEQALGENQVLDGRSDLFSVGLILWELLTAERLFRPKPSESSVAFLIRLHRPDAPVPIPRPSTRGYLGPKALEDICMGLLQRDLKKRTRSARLAWQQLQETGLDLSRGRNELAQLMGSKLFEASQMAPSSTLPFATALQAQQIPHLATEEDSSAFGEASGSPLVMNRAPSESAEEAGARSVQTRDERTPDRQLDSLNIDIETAEPIVESLPSLPNAKPRGLFQRVFVPIIAIACFLGGLSFVLDHWSASSKPEEATPKPQVRSEPGTEKVLEVPPVVLNKPSAADKTPHEKASEELGEKSKPPEKTKAKSKDRSIKKAAPRAAKKSLRKPPPFPSRKAEPKRESSPKVEETKKPVAPVLSEEQKRIIEAAKRGMPRE